MSAESIRSSSHGRSDALVSRGGLLLVGYLLAAVFVVGNLCAWQENVRPKLYVTLADKEYLRFQGNESTNDYFKLVLRDPNSNNLLVGARNIVYNLSIYDLVETTRLSWYSSDDDIKMCIVKGKDEDLCQNYIRVLAIPAQGSLLSCGTNAFRPICRTYSINGNNYSMETEKPGQAMCPYDPTHNSTAVFVDNELYSGTVADFSGLDPIIYREHLQTEQYDSLSLNAPNFVGSFTQGDFVYFFFRETAVEFINCGKAIFSRVARVCKWDKGGPNRLKNRWTSYLKSRLNCSMPGDFPFYFDEIQSTSNLVEGRYGHANSKLIYGVFSTAPNAIAGSAICAFSLQEISDTFEGNFKEQSGLNSNWLPVNPLKVPDPRPGSCHNDSRTLPDLTLNFKKTHSLMDETVPAFFGSPILTRVSTMYRFTAIAVDPQIKTPGGKTYDVIFVGTDHGKILKTVNAESADSNKKVTSVVIEEIDALQTNEPIRTLEIVRTTQYDTPKDGSYDDGKLIIVTDTTVLAIKLHRCSSEKITSCSECVALQDPYCAWDKIVGKCRSHGAPRWSEENVFYQSVATGDHAACPSGKMAKDANVVERQGYRDLEYDPQRPFRDQPADKIQFNSENYNDKGPQITPDLINAQYTVETLVMAVLAGAIFALLVGFITGYFCGRRCHKDEDDNLPYPDTEYEYFEQRQNVNRIQAEPKLLPQVEEVTYAEPVLLPQPSSQNKMQHSPKNTLRKPMGHHHGVNSETLFQFQPDNYNNARDNYRGRDNFGTLRSHQGDNYRRGDGFSTTRSVKKVGPDKEKKTNMFPGPFLL
ncbi:semaphorin-1A-like isoform X1 [Anopheles funestus]|uniref:semaphorin-1A-like isoform X1 n=1 Tax=Anopheles funestus TaxID=62324 RepID=UPI0020C670DE|nr:semaphorin-1A-like isoform X1 [Anopheles funestus]XP_049280163.1 semaphorin-1A-like isoform X1 [Anopheles funestus]XP_049280164.1 semaphorin-1A-like isoform X1 [Anopheles funestus]XP_049280165.1 semaphorin-1A-like isoform X1 [Anopheles funestus]XP_049280166.1 semaphorin-1A-like isoform X1 [Anopheles funestus]XP_049280167.1 semaphorin-1A-like isoform X1 [Anopheles funestus]XP_049280168.1 semaphorin-1A-like isoform X1 [Anopheles funestus]XP_049280170.1 semaphorin-1A-like isoform X1 [Anophel